ncbi:hypothetical protein [Sulfurimonas indica]|uniref:hypothetical protein n=1 Tax=Sulfurimonas indica TaxID=2508707 RepID=UPI001264F403|nr:hypothetical protein [Sulfurimonas indica]
MNDLKSILLDAQTEADIILQTNRQIEDIDFSDAKRLKQTAKINEQPAVVQKYWLGRLAYEFAIRNEDVKQIKKNASTLSKQVDFYDTLGYSEQEKYLTLKLHPYGFTAQPEHNVLYTSHTSYPARLYHFKYNYIEINTWKKVQKILAIIDGKKTDKQLNMNTDNYKQWKLIGEAYIDNYFELIDINLCPQDAVLTSDYEPLASKLQNKPTLFWNI